MGLMVINGVMIDDTVDVNAIDELVGFLMEGEDGCEIDHTDLEAQKISWRAKYGLTNDDY